MQKYNIRVKYVLSFHLRYNLLILGFSMKVQFNSVLDLVNRANKYLYFLGDFNINVIECQILPFNK